MMLRQTMQNLIVFQLNYLENCIGDLEGDVNIYFAKELFDDIADIVCDFMTESWGLK